MYVFKVFVIIENTIIDMIINLGNIKVRNNYFHSIKV